MINEFINELYSLDGVYQDTNVAGIYEDIRLVPTSWVEYINTQRDSSVLELGSIKLKSGKNWILIVAAQKSAFFDQNSIIDRNGTMYVSRLAVDLAFIRPSNIEFFRRYSKVPFIAMVRDKNGYTRLLGNIDEPILLENSSFSVQGKNKASLLFAGRHKNPAEFVDAVDDAVALISSTKELIDRNTLIISEIEALLQVISGLKNMLLNYGSYSLRAFTYIFDNASAELIVNRKRIDLPDIDVSKNIEVLGASLNGISIHCKVVNSIGVIGDWDDCIVVKELGMYRAWFNPKTISFIDENIFKVLVKIY